MTPQDEREKLYIEKYEYMYFATPTWPEYRRVGGHYGNFTYHRLLERLGKTSCLTNDIYQSYINGDMDIIGTKKDLCEEYGINPAAFSSTKQSDGSYYWPRRKLRIIKVEDRFYGIDDVIKNMSYDEIKSLGLDYFYPSSELEQED